MEDALGGSGIRPPAVQADLARAALSRPETALVPGTVGGSEGVPPHYRYINERQVLSIHVTATPIPVDGTYLFVPYEKDPPGTCVAGLPRAFEFARTGAVLASFALMDVQFPCAQGSLTLFSAEVPVPAAEMGKVFPRLAWEMDVTPVASRTGRLNGARVFRLPEGPTWYLTATRVRLHEMRLVDPLTDKVYFKAGPPRPTGTPESR
jgi:hypothetical protein